MKKINNILTRSLFFSIFVLSTAQGFAQQGSQGTTYPNLPVIAPMSMRIEKYIDRNESAKGPSILIGEGL